MLLINDTLKISVSHLERF